MNQLEARAKRQQMRNKKKHWPKRHVQWFYQLPGDLLVQAHIAKETGVRHSSVVVPHGAAVTSADTN